MNMHNPTSTRPALDWRGAFRLHYMDVTPRTDEGANAAKQGHWLLQDPLLRSIIVSISVDLRQLARWTGAYSNTSNTDLLDVAIARLAMSAAAPPTDVVGYVAFIARFVARALRATAKLQVEISAAKAAARPRNS